MRRYAIKSEFEKYVLDEMESMLDAMRGGSVQRAEVTEATLRNAERLLSQMNRVESLQPRELEKLQRDLANFADRLEAEGVPLVFVSVVEFAAEEVEEMLTQRSRHAARKRVYLDEDRARREVTPEVVYYIRNTGSGGFTMAKADTRTEAERRLEKLPAWEAEQFEIVEERELIKDVLKAHRHFIVAKRTPEGSDYFAGFGKWTSTLNEAKLYEDASSARRSAEYHARNQAHAFPVKRVWVFE